MPSATGRGHRAHPHGGPRRDARAVAVDALIRIDDGAYANIVLPHLLDRSDLSSQDRHFVTELVYGATRMRRACDWLADRYLLRDPDPETRAALRLGVYQLEFLRTPAHAAVNASVAVAPRRTRGLVNAILRRVASEGSPTAGDAAQGWPSDGVRLSYPDWIVERLRADLGEDGALASLQRMNEAPAVAVREDGYVQDPASRWVAEAVGAQVGERIGDLCAAPGGKATAMAAAGASLVIASDVRSSRVGLISANAAKLGAGAVAAMVADGTAPPLRPGSLDRVLIDAPCSGLGVLGRRPDARWRIKEADVESLAGLQRLLLDAAAPLVRPGGVLAYSVCTLTDAETSVVDRWFGMTHPDFEPIAGPGTPWRPHGSGVRLLPPDAGTDGMFLAMYRRSAPLSVP